MASKTLTISSKGKRQVIDITEQIAQQVSEVDDGVVQVFVTHTTAAVTTADLDPGTDADLLDFLQSMTPDVEWRHPHDPVHAPDHLWASLVGPSVGVPVQGGELALGTWQRIILVELDGPRDRQIIVTW
ncbi:MAG TPA: secondary thiamine-phosphate synthase enzyme YjbQ [Candidatus Saccharimonadales bacterium]|nr:secondary thiamine-phosphate synthase enzyme YjbQ [Candidatus Saccharimonadales bacterium]